MDKPPGSND